MIEKELANITKKQIIILFGHAIILTSKKEQEEIINKLSE